MRRSRPEVRRRDIVAAWTSPAGTRVIGEILTLLTGSNTTET
jgi:hypothetical protein